MSKFKLRFTSSLFILKFMNLFKKNIIFSLKKEINFIINFYKKKLFIIILIIKILIFNIFNEKKKKINKNL
jgi:hypothetical protein